MVDLNKVILCLENIKGKNLEQNPDNLTRFLIKDFGYKKEDADKLIEEAICANVIKSVIFNGKVSYRIVRADSVTDDTVLAPDSQEISMKDNHEENSNTTVAIEDTQDSSEQQQHNSDYDIATFMEKFRSSIDLIEKRFLKIDYHLIGLSCSKSTVNFNSRDTSNDNFYTGLLKNRIFKLEKQLAYKNAIIEVICSNYP